jgi:prepilin-type N-terminal cleavage/methylation domain-containing protein
MNQKGMTLIELLIALAIASSVVAAAAAAIFQLLTTPERNSDYMTAYTQVQNAGFSVSRDAVQAQNVTFDGGSFLTLDWVDWDGYAHHVVYTLEGPPGGLMKLLRTYSYSIDGVPKVETMVVAKYIIDPGTNCTWVGNVLTLEITAKVGDKTASRTYNVEPRPDS